MTSIAIAASFMGALGVVLATVIAFANRKLYVFEDPRIEAVEEMLPRANCGACGAAGCRQFAESLVAGSVDPGRCTVNSSDGNQAVADFLGVQVGEHERRVARLACAGGSHVATTHARYQGLRTCRAATLIGGGDKGCAWGCLGLGDCEKECEFGAIRMNRYGLPEVNSDKCTACGDCVTVCPKDLFSLQPVSHQLWVACRNRDREDEAASLCEVVCTACGRCAADAPEGLISIVDNLAVVDYGKNDLASRIPIERCPTGAIVWIEKDNAQKGVDAKKIARKDPLPPMRRLVRERL